MIRPYFSRVQLTQDRVAALVITLAPLVYFFPAVRGQLVISPDDGITFNIPLRVAAANLVRAGYLPLWNPYIFCGMPLLGAAQAGLLFPLNWFYLVFSPPLATNLMMLSTYMLAALGAYLYARRSGANIMGAVLTSLVWQWSGFLVNHIGHTNILHTAAMLPWLLWAIERYGTGGERSRGVLLAAIVALQIFAGHQQTFAYAILIAIAYVLVMSRAAKKSRTSYLWSLAFIAAGLGLAAVQILPTIELLRNSMRADSSYEFFTSFSMPPRFLWTFLAPYLMGGGDGQLFRAPFVGPAFYGEYVGYVGLGTIVLACLAVGLKRDARTKFWAVIAVVGVILALGRYAPFGFYRLIYAVPVLNLFRVPARHLMEVEFALAVLAGRGLTAIIDARDRVTTSKWVLVAGVAVFVLTCLAVTAGRPVNFHLGRFAPVSVLRAPELFLPIVFAALSVCALWTFAHRRRSGALIMLLLVIALDLCLWGQSSGWRVRSPKLDFELWGQPGTVEFLRAQAGRDRVEGNRAVPYRILTQEKTFDPARPGSDAQDSVLGGKWVPSLQPDIYMMYGIENAAGYDGFGLARYSRLAGDMKVWGELSDPKRTLSDESREMDLLNIRYLLARSAGVGVTSGATDTPGPAVEFPPATQLYAGQRFGDQDLNLPTIAANQRLTFNLPAIVADRIALLTNLAWSDAVPDGTVVAHVRLHAEGGQVFDFEIRAGEHTSEWAFDRPDIRSRIKHKQAPIATSYEVHEGQATYQAHTYVSTFALPRKTAITGGEITVERVLRAPDLALGVARIALADGDRAFPLRREWVKKEAATSTEQSTSRTESTTTPHWQALVELEDVAIFENTRMLPRTWIASKELVVADEVQLGIIRAGKLPDGATWQPLETALVESSTGLGFGNGDGPAGKAEITRNEPNKVEVKTESQAPAILILSANHYPGWRVYVDGRSVEVIRVNYNLRGVPVTAGEHKVEFVYRPKSVLIGLVVSLVAALNLAIWFWRKGYSTKSSWRNVPEP